MNDTDTNLECESCHEKKEGVKNCLDPYLADIHGEELYVNLCDQCYDDKVGDI